MNDVPGVSGDVEADEGGRKEGVGEASAERRSYAVGLALAVVLTAVPFALVGLGVLGRGATLWVIGGCALVQIVVHFRFFLHIDLSRQKREDLQLILFTTLILVLMCGGTIWILFDLYGRMMPSMTGSG